MKHLALLPILFAAVLPFASPATAAIAATDWPAWRGPTRDGLAAPGAVER